MTFTTPYWRFDRGSSRWELRIRASASDAAGLGALRDADSVDRFELHRTDDTTAFVRSIFEKTTAIGTVARRGGYVVGPFHSEAGIERLHLGFDTEAAADVALADRNREETVTVHDRRRIADAAGRESHPVAERTGQRPELTHHERAVLETALDRGYYNSPLTIAAAALGAV